MNEERMKILNMLSEGKISAEDADKLISAIGEQMSPSVSSGGLPKYLFIHVNSLDDNNKENVNIKVPIALLKAGVNIASLMPEDIQGEINNAMGKKGIQFNLSDIKKENLDEFIIALRELEVNVDGGNEKIRIYCS